MLLLVLFALLAGAATALSPCVLPVLPAVLSAGVTGGRRRPIGVAVGLALSFGVGAVALVYVIDALGLPNNIQRIVAIVVLGGFGLALIVRPLADRIEAFASRAVGAPRVAGGDGLGSGLLLGASLGLVYLPCAGPILAGIITVSAAQDFTVGRLAVAIAYGLGSGVVLYLAMVGGRHFRDRIGAAMRWVQPAMGTVMVAVAILISADLDIRFQNAIADDLPDFLTNPTGAIEETDAVLSRVNDVRGGVSAHGGTGEGGVEQVATGARLPELADAPEITEPGTFFNTDGEPVSISELNAEGRVVLIDFWTYTCINCIRTLPQLTAWDERYRDEGLTIVGVHSPEFPFEREAENVREAIEQNGIDYPVVQDNDFGTWSAFGNQFWPAKYLIDADGKIRFAHFGEGAYAETEKAIRTLLAEAGNPAIGNQLTSASTETASPRVQTPETYLGSQRADGFVSGEVTPGTKDFGRISPQRIELLPPNAFAFQGPWRISPDGAKALGGSRLDARFTAGEVYLVLSREGGPSGVSVELDGEPIRAADAGVDVEGGRVEVGRQRLYRLVDLPKVGNHRLTLRFDRGVSGYAFTFG